MIFLLVRVSDFYVTIVYPDGRLCISILHPPGDDPVSGEKAEVSIAPCALVERKVTEQSNLL